jgi:hypothetical protein
MTSHYAVPTANGSCALLRIEGEHTTEQAWIAITAEQYATLSETGRGLHIVNGAPAVRAVKPVRVIPRGVFMDRFTPTEQVALEEIAEGQTQGGRVVRVFTRRLEAETHVNLNSAALIAALGQLKTILRAANVWTSDAEADTRIAALTADG